MSVSVNKNKSISYMIIFAISIAPLIFLRRALTIPIINYIIIDYFMQPKLIFLDIIAIAIILILLFDRNTEQAIVQKQLPEYLLAIYAALLILSTLFSVNPYISLIGDLGYNEGLLTILLYIFFYLVTKRYYSYSNIHMHFILLSALLIGIYGIVQFFGFDLTVTKMTGKVYATFRNPNYFGAYLVLILPIAIFKYMKTTKWYYLPIVSILYFCLLATSTRGSWIGFFFALATLFYFSKKLKFQFKRLIIVIILLVIITISFNIINNDNIRTRLLSIFSDFNNVITLSEDYEGAGSKRILIWKYAIQLIKDNPLLGTGIETFNLLVSEDFIFKVHNEYLSIAQSSGIPSLVVYLVWLSYIVRKGINAVPEKIEALPFIASIIGYAVQAFFNVSVVAVAIIFWCFCGILNNLFENSKQQENSI